MYEQSYVHIIGSSTYTGYKVGGNFPYTGVCVVVVRAEWVVVLRLSQKQEDGLFTRSDLVLSLCAFAPQLAAVHLVDSHYCTDPGKFISVLCTSLSTMLHVELPHVNVLSKMDLIEQYGKLGKRLC